jgi:hypothetical protein
MYSAAEPDFYRIYCSEQSSDVVRDSESDRVQTFVFKASGPKLLARRCSRQSAIRYCRLADDLECVSRTQHGAILPVASNQHHADREPC